MRPDSREKALYVSKNRSEQSSIMMNLQNIIFIERKESLSIMFFKDGGIKYFYEPLKYFESLLGSTKLFIRVERNHIVNISHINEFEPVKKNKTAIIKINEKEFQVSRRRLPLFRKKYKTVQNNYIVMGFCVAVIPKESVHN